MYERNHVGFSRHNFEFLREVITDSNVTYTLSRITLKQNIKPMAKLTNHLSQMWHCVNLELPSLRVRLTLSSIAVLMLI